MTKQTDLRSILETVRRHVERAAAGTGLQPTTMAVDLRFGLETDERGMVKPVLRTATTSSGESPHSLRMVVDLKE